MAIAAAVLGACSDRAHPEPLPPGVLADEATLAADRDRADVVAMRRHAWALWAAITAPTTRGEPVWETWVRADRVFASEAGDDGDVRGLHFRQARGAQAPSTAMSLSPPPLSFVMFDREAADHIRAHGLASRATLAQLAASAHAMPPFPRGAIAMKLVWFPIRRRGLTAVPVWDGAPTHADADGNGAPTWARVVAVDPTLADAEAADADVAIAHDRDAVVIVGGHAVRAHRVPLARFYHRVLATDAEVRSARAATGDATIVRGDHVALVAVHITTKELPDWTWSTLWWHDRPDAGAFAADRPAAVRGAFRNYVMDAIDDADTPREPDGAPRVCFNPWIEARFPGGLHSNCVACHQRAVLGAADFLPVTRGRTAADDPVLVGPGRMATDFVWSIALEAR